MLFSCLAVIANIVVLFILKRKQNQRTPFDLVIGSLSFTDTLAAVCSIVFAGFSITIHIYNHRQIEGNIMASHHLYSQAYLAIDVAYFFFFLTLMHILLITFVRFTAIFWPLKFRQHMTNSIMKSIIAATWALSTIIVAVLLMELKSSLVYGIILFSSGGVVFWVYIMIAVKICLLVKKRHFNWRREHCVLLNSLGVTITYFACLSPIGHLQLKSTSIISEAGSLPLSLIPINFLLDPLFYFYFSYWLDKRDEARRNRVNAT